MPKFPVSTHARHSAKHWGLAAFLGLARVAAPSVAAAQTRTIPADCSPINVKDPTYGAQGDGVTDDTAAIRKALIGDRTTAPLETQPDYYDPRPRVVYFPAGTYLVSDSLVWVGGALQLQGTGSSTVIQLKDSAAGFDDGTKKKPVLQTPAGNYSFKNHIFDLVVDTGKNNPGAVGIDWIDNNVGALRNVTVRSGDGKGITGIDLTRQWPGPSLLRGVTVQGFDYGVDVAGSEYGMTFEDLTLKGQNIAALRNRDNVLCIRKLHTEAVPLAIDNQTSNGLVLLLDSTLNGAGNVAFKNGGHAYVRHVTSTGFTTLLEEQGVAMPGTSVADERLTGSIQQLFPSPPRSLNLPIEELPTLVDEPAASWKKIDCDYQGCEGVLQDALDSGASTLYFQFGVRLIGGGTFKVPKTVKRIVGFGTHINTYDQYGLTFQVTEAAAEPLVIEHFAGSLNVLHDGPRSVVVRSAQLGYQAKPGAGKLFLDDVGTSSIATVPGQKVWAWQLNIEGDQLHIDNAGASVWVFGLKSERRGTIARTTQGGYTEFLGSLLYGTESWDANSPQAAFINVESSHSIIFAMSSYVTNGFYPNVVDETRDGVQKTLPSSSLDGRFMPLFVGYKTPPPSASGSGGSGGAGEIAGAAGSGAAGSGAAGSGARGSVGGDSTGGAGPGSAGAENAGAAAGSASHASSCGCRTPGGTRTRGGRLALALLLSGAAWRRARRRKAG